MEKLKVGITIGDFNGIGPELIIRGLQDKRLLDIFTPVIYGSARVISYYKKMLSLPEPHFQSIRSADEIQHGRLQVINVHDDELEIKPGEATSAAGAFALQAFDRCISDIQTGRIHVMVTAPLNKHTVPAKDGSFTGHTGYLAEKFGGSDYLMLLVAEHIKVGLITGHMPLKDVAQRISPELIKRKATLLIDSLKRDFRLPKPRVAVLGINPHAGDQGTIGQEETTFVAETIAKLRDEGHLIYGPYPADGFFGAEQYRQFDAVLAMYHDQGLIPFKTLAFQEGVNFTAGLPVVRTSPDHGTAYDLTGKKKADITSFMEAIFKGIEIYRTRHDVDQLLANPLPFASMRRERFKMDF